jgi:hypothetical protein
VFGLSAYQHGPGPPNVSDLPEPAKRFALLIGVEDYSDGVTPLQGPNNDAHEIERVLETYGGFPSDQVFVLTSDQSDDQRKPSHNQIFKRLDMLKSRVPSDGLLVVAFSGHGIERGGVAYLLPSDAEMGSAELLENTSISELKLRDSIKHVGVTQVIVFLDACRDNPEKSKGVGDNNLTPAFRMKGADWNTVNTGITALAVLYATEEGHRAYIAQQRKQGYFSMAFVEGISGEAKDDRNQITLGSLMKYLQKRVPKLVTDEYGVSAVQKPISDIRGYLADDLVVASIPVVSPTITYSVDIRLRPVLLDENSTVSVRLQSIPFSASASAVAIGTEKTWADRAFNGTHLTNAFQYSLPIPAGTRISGWSYDVIVRHIQSDGVVKIELSEKKPTSMGVRTSVIGNGILSVDVSQAAEGWK